MPSNAPLVINVSTLPADYCFESFQKLLDDFGALFSGYVSGNYNFFFYGNGTPDVPPDDRDKPWFRTNGDGTFDKWYNYVDGHWASPHSIPANSPIRQIYRGTEASLKTYDGGVDEAQADAYTGPMWEVDHDFDFRSPMGVATSPAPHSTVLALNATLGEEQHTQLLAELATHKHEPPTGQTPLQSVDRSGGGGGTGLKEAGVGTDYPSPDTNWTANTGSSTPMNVVHPVLGTFFIKRTGRTYFVI